MVDGNCRKGSSKGQQVLNGEDGYFLFSLLQELQELHCPINFEKVAPPHPTPPPPLLLQL